MTSAHRYKRLNPPGITQAITALICAFFLITTIKDLHAQTVRVSVGANTEGHQHFMEVFEYDFVSEKPHFPGGDHNFLDYINRNRKYPAKAYRQGVQGRVTCDFVVNADGHISHIRILKSVEPSLNREAMRLLSDMPAWTPGTIDGVAVPVRVIWSIPFRK